MVITYQNVNMFSIPDWDISTLNEKVTSQFFGSNSAALTRKQKARKKLDSDKHVKHQKQSLLQTQVHKQVKSATFKKTVSKKVKKKIIPKQNSVKNNHLQFNFQNVEASDPQGTSISTTKFESSTSERNARNFQSNKKKRNHSVLVASNVDSVENKMKNIKQKTVSLEKSANKTTESSQLKTLKPNLSKTLMNMKPSISGTEVTNIKSLKKKRKRSLSLASDTGIKDENNAKKKRKKTSKNKILMSECNVSSKSTTEDMQEENKEISIKRKKRNRRRKKQKNVPDNNIQNNEKRLDSEKVSTEDIQEENKEISTKRKKRNRCRKKQKNVPDNNIQNNEKHLDSENVSTGKASYNIEKLKHLFSASKEEPRKDRRTEKKQINESFSLRERMMKRLQASRFRYLNEQLYTADGKDAKEYFQSDPEAFQAYHEGYQQQVKQWPINPLDIIISAIRKKSSKLVIADFGCGDARLASSVPNRVHSFDLLAVSEKVTACNMAHTPLSSSSVDIVVFCLSLMGTNLAAYMTEANRVLKEGGLLKIAEVESRFENIETFIEKLQKFGFTCTWKDLSHNLFYFMDFKKEKGTQMSARKT